MLRFKHQPLFFEFLIKLSSGDLIRLETIIHCLVEAHSRRPHCVLDGKTA